MKNPVDPISEAKALKTQLVALLRDFSERTKYMVRKVDTLAHYQRVNADGRSWDQLSDVELRKLIVEAPDGTVVEV